MSATRKVVLDASAVLAYVLQERGWATVEKMLPVAVIPAPNMAEAIFIAISRGWAGTADQLFDSLLSTGLEVEPLLPGDSIRAAELMGQSRGDGHQGGTLSLGDGLCLSVAERLNLYVAGGDQAWSTLDLEVEFYPFR